VGLVRFYALHQHRMSGDQRRRFRQRMEREGVVDVPLEAE
jgi:hypothetical protein